MKSVKDTYEEAYRDMMGGRTIHAALRLGQIGQRAAAGKFSAKDQEIALKARDLLFSILKAELDATQPEDNSHLIRAIQAGK